MIILIFKIIRLKRKKKKKTQNQKAPKFDPKLLISSYPHIDEFPDFEPTKPKKTRKIELKLKHCRVYCITPPVCSDLPIRPPLTSEQMPTSWWIPNCCDKSLLVGTYKHGCENYQEIRSDSTLCFITHIGLPPSSSSSTVEDAAAGGAIANNKAATPTAAAAAATK